MSSPDWFMVILWAGVTAYAVLGGADFGGGVLDLAARGPRATPQRSAISRAMGPVWEANHVWLIFFLTGLFSAFPRAFAVLSVALYLPVTLALAGIVLRGAAFAFRSHAEGDEVTASRLGILFGAVSAITPFLFGAAAGAIARGDIHDRGGHTRIPGILSIWLGPFQLACGALALAACTYLASTFLCVEVRRARRPDLLADFRTRALWAAVTTGVLSIAALALAATDAPRLYHGLTASGLPLVIIGVLAGTVSLAALWRLRFGLARVAAAVAVTAVLWGWGVAQYPQLAGPDVTIASAAADPASISALLVVFAAGMALLAPSLWLLYGLFRRTPIDLSE